MSDPTPGPASLAALISGLALTDGLPSPGPATRPGTKSADEIRRLIDPVLLRFHTPLETQELVRACGLLWHDHLDDAHELVQQSESADGAFIHGIIHRREPDYSNARYWFHRVGRHAAFPTLARQVATLGHHPGARRCPDLVRSGEWQPMDLIEACERFAGAVGSAEYQLLQRVQELELRTLLDHLCAVP